MNCSASLTVLLAVLVNLFPMLALADDWPMRGRNMFRSISGLCVTGTLLFESDIHGIVRCFDKLSGKLHWKHDLYAAALGTPLVVGDTLYVADEDGDVEVLKASATYEPITDINHEQPIYSSPVYANDTMYIVTRYEVFAIGK